LRDFWENYPDSEQYLKTWYETAKNSNWNSPNEIKQTNVNASILKESRVVFNIKGNSYRLVVKFNFDRKWAFVRFIETHSEYDKIDVNTI
jgi:mRNA interferase HigB